MNLSHAKPSLYAASASIMVLRLNSNFNHEKRLCDLIFQLNLNGLFRSKLMVINCYLDSFVHKHQIANLTQHLNFTTDYSQHKSNQFSSYLQIYNIMGTHESQQKDFFIQNQRSQSSATLLQSCQPNKLRLRPAIKLPINASNPLLIDQVYQQLFENVPVGWQEDQYFVVSEEARQLGNFTEPQQEQEWEKKSEIDIEIYYIIEKEKKKEKSHHSSDDGYQKQRHVTYFKDYEIITPQEQQQWVLQQLDAALNGEFQVYNPHDGQSMQLYFIPQPEIDQIQSQTDQYQRSLLENCAIGYVKWTAAIADNSQDSQYQRDIRNWLSKIKIPASDNIEDGAIFAKWAKYWLLSRRTTLPGFDNYVCKTRLDKCSLDC